MSVEKEAVLRYWEHQYEDQKRVLIEHVNSEYWWDANFFEEDIAKMATRLASLRGIIKVLKSEIY